MIKQILHLPFLFFHMNKIVKIKKNLAKESNVSTCENNIFIPLINCGRLKTPSLSLSNTEKSLSEMIPGKS